jgi:hypothetical protein
MVKIGGSSRKRPTVAEKFAASLEIEVWTLTSGVSSSELLVTTHPELESLREIVP